MSIFQSLKLSSNTAGWRRYCFLFSFAVWGAVFKSTAATALFSSLLGCFNFTEIEIIVVEHEFRRYLSRPAKTGIKFLKGTEF